MEANTELGKAKKAFNDANTASNEYSTTISNYETAMGTVRLEVQIASSSGSCIVE